MAGFTGDDARKPGTPQCAFPTRAAVCCQPSAPLGVRPVSTLWVKMVLAGDKKSSLVVFSEVTASGSSSDPSLRSSSTALRAAAMPRHLGVSSQLLVAEPAGDMQISQMHVAESRNLPNSAAEPQAYVCGSAMRLASSSGVIVGVDACI